MVGTSAALPSVAPRHRPPRVAVLPRSIESCAPFRWPPEMNQILSQVWLILMNPNRFPSMINHQIPYQSDLQTRCLLFPSGDVNPQPFQPSSLWQHRFGPAGPLLHCIWSVAWFSNFWRYSPVINVASGNPLEMGVSIISIGNSPINSALSIAMFDYRSVFQVVVYCVGQGTHSRLQFWFRYFSRGASPLFFYFCNFFVCFVMHSWRNG